MSWLLKLRKQKIFQIKNDVDTLETLKDTIESKFKLLKQQSASGLYREELRRLIIRMGAKKYDIGVKAHYGCYTSATDKELSVLNSDIDKLIDLLGD